MLWEKKTSKQIKEKSESRGYLYLRISEYVRDNRTLMRKPKHLSDGSKHKERNKYIKKKDIYLGKIQEIAPTIYMSFQDYIISYLEKEEDFLHYVLSYTFDELFYDFISYLEEIYEFDFQVLKQDLKSTEDEIKHLKTKTYALKTGGFFNIILLRRAFDFECRKSNEVSANDFSNFSNRCYDCGIYDEHIQMVLYSKLIHVSNFQELEEEIAQLQFEKSQESKTDDDSFEGFMRRMHKD